MASTVQDREFARHVRQRHALLERLRVASPDVRCARPRDEGHRATDWRLKTGGPRVCGVCHPPAVPAAAERV